MEIQESLISFLIQAGAHGADALGHAVRLAHHFRSLRTQLRAIRSRLPHVLLLARSADDSSQPGKTSASTSSTPSSPSWIHPCST